MTTYRDFPVHSEDVRRIGGQRTVPWEFLLPHEQQALHNHGQTLERLAERGGLGWGEMLDIVNGAKWATSHRAGVSTEEARRQVLAAIESWMRR